MIEPKNFYRKLDALLNKIGRGRTGKDFLFTIVKELGDTFGNDLRLMNGRIYQESPEEYVLISTQDTNALTSIPIQSKAIQNLLQYKTYIFNDPVVGAEFGITNPKEYVIPAAVTVHSPEENWIFVFELRSGWIREEIEFCLNAVRTALNNRLHSEAFQSDLKQAAFIQQSLLPAEAPQIPGYDIAGYSQPAELVGGDLYDYYEFDGQDFGICIGDASGHGLPAALLARDVVTGLRMGMEREMKMTYALKKLNSVIYRTVYSTKFVSLFVAEIQSNGNIIYVNAGHPSPLLISGNQVQELESTGLIFGALPEISISTSFTKMNPGSILVLYSDGIVERMNKSQTEFGMNRLKELIKTSQDKTAREIIDTIFSGVNEYGKKSKWEDDATMMVLKKLK